MKQLTTIIILLLLLSAFAFAGDKTPQTLRVDYYHTGNAITEIFSLHQVVIEPLPWPGNPDQPVDNTNRGLYLFEVVEPVTNKILYSRGYASIFGEWQFTREATKMHKTFHESVRFPNPGKVVRLRISKRDDANRFAQVWSTEIDPNDMLVIRKNKPAVSETIAIMDNGDPAKKVDLLIIGDGYTEKDAELFKKDAQRISNALFAVDPYKNRKKDFNVWAINPPSPESGTNRPSNGTFRYSPTGTGYDAFRSERYVLSFNNENLREIAQYAPYDAVIIMTNSETYGGGGIFNLYTTAAAHSEWASYLVPHEMGHSFAALADEYYTSDTAYESGNLLVEPWEPNVTAMHDPNNIKWKELVTKDTKLPTVWPKAEFEAFQKENQANRRKLRKENRPESEMNTLFRNEQKFVEGLFKKCDNHKALGAFEGANYSAKGYYRSQINCLMFTRTTFYCKVCQRAIEDIIDLYTK